MKLVIEMLLALRLSKSSDKVISSMKDTKGAKGDIGSCRSVFRQNNEPPSSGTLHVTQPLTNSFQSVRCVKVTESVMKLKLH